jgi:hypothetical protein
MFEHVLSMIPLAVNQIHWGHPLAAEKLGKLRTHLVVTGTPYGNFYFGTRRFNDLPFGPSNR